METLNNKLNNLKKKEKKKVPAINSAEMLSNMTITMSDRTNFLISINVNRLWCMMGGGIKSLICPSKKNVSVK
jgi:hypothetical protein